MAQQRRGRNVLKTTTARNNSASTNSRVNLLGGPKVMTFNGIRLRSNIDAFVSAMKLKGLEPIGDIAYGDDGSCVAVATFQYTNNGHQVDITVNAGPDRHLVDEVVYSESGFKTDSEARYRISVLRGEKTAEMGNRYIHDNGYRVWRYGYIKWESKKSVFDNTYYMVMRIIDHPAHCLSIRETNKCFKASLGIGEMKSLEETKELPVENDVKEVTPIDDAETNKWRTPNKEVVPEKKVLPEDNGNTPTPRLYEDKKEKTVPEKQVMVRDTIPPPPPKKHSGSVHSSSILELADRLLDINNVDKIQNELEQNEGFIITKLIFSPGFSGSSSKYPDGQLEVVKLKKKDPSIKVIDVSMKITDKNVVLQTLKDIGYVKEKNDVTGVENTTFSYLSKGNHHVQVMLFYYQGEPCISCKFTIQ